MNKTIKSPTLIILNGLPATGKTTLGRKIAEELELPFISKDDFKELLFDTLGYSDQKWSQEVGASSFKLLYQATENILKANKSVVVETCFDPKYDEKQFTNMQGKYNTKIFQIFCKCDGKVLFDRFKKRTESGPRHPGHNDTTQLKKWKPIMLNNDLKPLEIGGETLVVDTTVFEDIDQESILRKIKTTML